MLYMRIKIQYVHHREHSVLPLEMPVREYCAGKYTLFFFCENHTIYFNTLWRKKRRYLP